jgi:hypothetical protein
VRHFSGQFTKTIGSSSAEPFRRWEKCQFRRHLRVGGQIDTQLVGDASTDLLSRVPALADAWTEIRSQVPVVVVAIRLEE